MAEQRPSQEERWQRRLDRPMILAAVLVIPAIVLDAGHYGPGWSRLGTALNWGTWLAFLAEIGIMLAVVGDRGRWLRDHPVELVATLLSPPLLPGPLQAIRVLRLLRLLRLLRTLKTLRRLLTPEGIRDAALLTGFLVLAGGVAFSEVESDQHLSAWDGVWWAMSTITTVGYGDVTPQTTAGRLIAITMMLAGIGFVALLTAAVAQRFIADEHRSDRALEHHLGGVVDELRRIHQRLDQLEARLPAASEEGEP